jgi:hypothetical protein
LHEYRTRKAKPRNFFISFPRYRGIHRPCHPPIVIS